MSLARKSLAALLCLSPLAALAQNPATFKTLSSPTTPSTFNTYTVDVNNDGSLDLIQDTNTSPNGFSVSLSKGDGTFSAPIFTAFANQVGQTVTPLAIGDFNGDGKVDVAAAFTSSNLVQVYLGNGDGTFQPAKSTTVSFIGGQSFAFAPIAAADFNHDGKLDMVFAGSIGETSTVYLLPGQGNGTFGTAIPLITPPSANSPYGSTVYNVTTGDYDSNGSGDIAFTAITLNSSGKIATTAVYVLYGNGDNTFSSRVVYTTNGNLSLASGDLNGDGFTDLFGIDSTNQRLVTLYSEPGNLAFTPYFTPLPGASDGFQYNYALGSFAPVLSLADFNNDGLSDLVAYAYNPGNNTSSLVFFTAIYNQPGIFNTEQPMLPAYTYNASPVVADFNRDTKPDVAIVQFNAYGPITITSLINETSGGGLWSNCAYPLQGNGLSLCSPTSITGPDLLFSATSNSFGQVRKIELWVDGKKITEQHNTWGHNAFFAAAINFAAGKHLGTLYEADIDDTLQRLDFNFTSGPSPCATPTSPGVHICSPTVSSTSPIDVEASVKVLSALERIEVWVDGVKKFTNSTGSPTVSTYVPVTPGNHQVTVYAVDEDNQTWDQTVTVTTH